MTAFPSITRDRCRILPFAERHLTDRYVGWLNDPEVVRYSEQRHRTHDRASCAAYFAAIQASPDLFLAIEATHPSLGHVGNISVAFDAPNRSADVSIMVGEAAARGTGIGSIAWSSVVDWLLSNGGMRRVTAGTMAVNHAMIALMQKSGMAIEATRRGAFLLDGAEVDMVLAVRFSDLQPRKV